MTGYCLWRLTAFYEDEFGCLGAKDTGRLILGVTETGFRDA